MKKQPLTPGLKKLAGALALTGDPARIRILCALFEAKKACVGDIAGSLAMSLASVSHHLQLLHQSGMLDSQREGKNICYSLSNTSLNSDLKKLICKHIKNDK